MIFWRQPLESTIDTRMGFQARLANALEGEFGVKSLIFSLALSDDQLAEAD